MHSSGHTQKQKTKPRLCLRSLSGQLFSLRSCSELPSTDLDSGFSVCLTNQVRSLAAGYPGLTWGATGWLGSKGDGLSPRTRGMSRSEASSPGFVTVTPACCDGKTARTLPARPLCWPGDGSHRRDRALSCQPPRQVTARPQRHTYRKSLVLTLKKKKHTKGQTSKSPTELFPTAKSQGACTGGL